MPAINAKNLRLLRQKRSWSLDELSRLSGIERGTISRIENGKQTGRRRTTIKKLADALGTDAETLTGADISSAGKDFESVSKSKLTIQIDNSARNALSLVAIRYGVKPSQIIQIAPLMFLWAAEQSLKQRRAGLEALEAQWDAIKTPAGLKHLSGGITYPRDEDAIVQERQSIAQRDLFGLNLDGDAFHHAYEESEQNPLAQFMHQLCDDLDGLAEFEFWGPFWDCPGYTLGRQEASAMVDGNEKALNHILSGYAPLHELTKEVREAGPQAVAQWASERGDEVLSNLFGDFNLVGLDISEPTTEPSVSGSDDND